MTNKSERLIDARNGCYGGSEEATADDGVLEQFAGENKASPALTQGVLTSPAMPLLLAKSCPVQPSPAIQAEAPKYDGNLLPAMTAMVTGFVDKLAKFYSPCPQGKDCAGDGKHHRIFACDHCSFVGCCACLDLHEAGGHESDSSTARERINV